MHTPLEEGDDIYVEPPRELVPDRSVVWKLKRALNGLVGASRKFQKFLHNILTTKMGFKACQAVPVLYRHTEMMVVLPCTSTTPWPQQKE